MTPGRPPRARGLILALVAVLVLMSYAFWRAAADPRAASVTKKDEAADDAARAPRTASAGPAAPASSGDASATGDSGGQRTAAAAPASVTAPAGRPDAGRATAPGREIDESHLMARLRTMKDSDPAGAVPLAREGNRRFPDSADAPERTSILIHALVAVDKGSEARGEAEQMVNHYPDSPWVREVEHFTGAHRHRNVSVNDAGQLIFR